MNCASPIFIVGMMRSGTTLMSKLLDRHPRIAIPPAETHMLDIWTHKCRRLDLSRVEDFDKFWGGFTEYANLTQCALDSSLVRERILSGGSVSFQSVLTTILEVYAERTGKARYGEKTPLHALHLDRIFEWYPGAQVIFMMRDPRAVLASLTQVPWGAQWLDYETRQWVRIARFCDSFASDQRVFRVRYEDLAEDGERVLRRLCEFLGEDYENSMLNAAEAAPETSKKLAPLEGWDLEHHRKSLEPITKESIDKWKTMLSAYQVGVIETIAGKEMEKHGYKRTSEGLSIGEQVRMRRDRVVRSMAHLQKRVQRRVLIFLGQAEP